MAKYVMCVIKDSAADQFGVPYFTAAIGVATRGFTAEVNRADAQNMMYQHPTDFDLYTCGTYDSDTAEVTPMPLQRVVRGVDVKAG